MSDFKNAVHTKRRKQDYTLANIGNMDETLVRFDMAQKSTNTIKGENNVRIATTGGAKKGFTVALTALANGTKLPACVIFKEGRLARIPPRVMAALRIPNIVRVSATQNGWMTGADMANGQYDKIGYGPNRDDVRRLLLLDQARVHTMNDTKTALANIQTDIIYVPAGCTSIAQPADVSWNTPFKTLLRAEWK